MTEGRSDLVDVELVYLRDTPSGKAHIVRHPDGKADAVVFLPVSLVERDGDVFTMPRWLAEEKGLDGAVTA